MEGSSSSSQVKGKKSICLLYFFENYLSYILLFNFVKLLLELEPGPVDKSVLYLQHEHRSDNEALMTVYIYEIQITLMY